MESFVFALDIDQQLGMYVGIPLAVIMLSCIVFLRVWARHLNKKAQNKPEKPNEPKEQPAPSKPVETSDLKNVKRTTITTTTTTTTPETSSS